MLWSGTLGRVLLTLLPWFPVALLRSVLICKLSHNVHRVRRWGSSIYNVWDPYWAVSVTCDVPSGQTYEEPQTLQTESTWRRWENQKPAWSQWRATLVHLQTEIREGGLLWDSTWCFFMGVFYCTCVAMVVQGNKPEIRAKYNRSYVWPAEYFND